MKRNFPNFLEAYWSYALDNFCPDQFHHWTGLSILSGALERKVWIREGKTFIHPNIYVLLVAAPAIGKSTAITRGSPLIEAVRAEYNNDLKLMTGTLTQAGLCEEMNILNSMQIDETTIVQYSYVYYYSSEGSGSALTNLFGDFNALITELYDCNDKYTKRLKEKYYNITNPGFGMIAGCTFEFLKRLVDQNSVMGGLASRFIYVVEHDRKIKRGKSELGSAYVEADTTYKRKLIEDLALINKLQGAFRIEKTALVLYDKWFERYADESERLASERMQSIMSRKPTNLKKLAMLFSIAERDDLSITAQHMETAIEFIDNVTKDNASIIASAVIGRKMDQSAVTQFILQTLKTSGGNLTHKELLSKYVSWGGETNRYESTIKMLITSGYIEADSASGLTLLIDPNAHL